MGQGDITKLWLSASFLLYLTHFWTDLDEPGTDIIWNYPTKLTTQAAKPKDRF